MSVEELKENYPGTREICAISVTPASSRKRCSSGERRSSHGVSTAACVGSIFSRQVKPHAENDRRSNPFRQYYEGRYAAAFSCGAAEMQKASRITLSGNPHFFYLPAATIDI
jgi:hypothetical protein